MADTKGMTTTQRKAGQLTKAAERDLLLLGHGETVDMRYGPWEQLQRLGYIEGGGASDQITTPSQLTQAGKERCRSLRLLTRNGGRGW